MINSNLSLENLKQVSKTIDYEGKDKYAGGARSNIPGLIDPL